MKSEKGNRKLLVARQSALFLLAGLVVICALSLFGAIKPSDCAQLYMWYAAGVVGKDTAFMWGNAREHAAAASNPCVPEAPKPSA